SPGSLIADQPALRSLRQVDLVGPNAAGAADVQAAIVLFAQGAPLQAQLEVRIVLLGAQVRAAAPGQFDDTVLHLPVARQLRRRGRVAAEAPAREILAVEQRDESSLLLLLTDLLGPSRGSHEERQGR